MADHEQDLCSHWRRARVIQFHFFQFGENLTKERKMARAFEISVWKPHAGKRAECLNRMKEWREVSLKAGVSS